MLCMFFSLAAVAASTEQRDVLAKTEKIASPYAQQSSSRFQLLILFLGQPDQIREEHTQSTHRAHTEATKPERAEVVV